MNTTTDFTDFVAETPVLSEQPQSPKSYSLNRFQVACARVSGLIATAISNLDAASLKNDSPEDIQFWVNTLFLYRGVWDELKRIQKRMDGFTLPADKLVVLECMGDEFMAGCSATSSSPTFQMKLTGEPMTVKHMYMCSIFSYISGNVDGSIWGEADVE